MARRKSPSEHESSVSVATEVVGGGEDVGVISPRGMVELILAGTRDPLIHVANAKLMHRLIPNSRLQLIDDGHLFLLTNRQLAADSIARFLRDDDPLAADRTDRAGGRPAWRASA